MTLAPPDWKFTSGNSTALALFGAHDEQELLSHDPSDYYPRGSWMAVALSMLQR
jgi:hypothetical protein